MINRYIKAVIVSMISLFVVNHVYAHHSTHQENQITGVDNVLRVFVHAYEKGDLKQLMKFYAPNAIVIGTGSDEILKGRAAIAAGFKRDFGQHDTASIKLEKIAITVNQDTAFAAYKLLVNIGFQDKKSFQSELRFTVGLVRNDNKWLITQSHLSSPMDNQKAGEAFPAT